MGETEPQEPGPGTVETADPDPVPDERAEDQAGRRPVAAIGEDRKQTVRGGETEVTGTVGADGENAHRATVAGARDNM
jgi:hypothetical protein